MSSFTKPLIVEELDDGVSWRIVEPFEYLVGSEQSGESIWVPMGFITDFASIPRPLWSIIGGPTGKYGKAAVVHDYLYRTGGRIPHAVAADGSVTYRIYTKTQADAIFYEAMNVLGVGRFQRWVMYQAVRVFGRGAFA